MRATKVIETKELNNLATVIITPIEGYTNLPKNKPTAGTR
ncbi:hypothetical protein SAL_1493 [Streptococcus agalactiae 515]|nr:hypothetical protein SAL_1493 [Streptococcus agalactiae 515]